MLNHLLFSAWTITLAWAGYAAFTLYSALWTGLVIALTGLAASLLVVGAFYSRSQIRSRR